MKKSLDGIPIAAVLASVILLAACASGPEEYDAGDEGPLLGGSVVMAVFDFEVKSGVPGYEALATDVPNALVEAFIAGGIVRPLERSALEKVFAEQELALSGMVDAGTAVRIGKLAGARYALLGTIAVVGEQIRLSCRVIDVETGEIVYAGSAYGDADEIFGIEEDLAGLIEADFS